MDVNRVYSAALELQAALGEVRRPYCFIGGLAVQRWGEIRFTQDADATVLTEFQFDEEVVDQLLARFAARRPDARQIALHQRVLLLKSSQGVHLDVALGALDFEKHAIDRSSFWRVITGDDLRTCSAEDLIVHKAFASRDKDWLDIKGILIRQGPRLNVGQILEELRILEPLSEKEPIIPQLEALLRKQRLI